MLFEIIFDLNIVLMSIFKKYDIRGLYPTEVNETLARQVADVLAQKLFERGKVVVGHDPRGSSLPLYKALISALEGYPDVELAKAGMITTPMLTFLVHHLRAAGGIVVTASHNPKEYNGFKVIGDQGLLVGGEDIAKWIQK
ncbi:MAG: hypothetical protein A2Y84_01445 [Candidatus Colwellbacteria bacterium RBG_13_48_8]|uniref:Alpha-D-phosphohexomutase alpha/beta/alpha domain-containing protein n=1 Tax=Candidatus Colwellbacteria bacterium RBG_13_48_8 TaxID=1797685 RepID=A0A1G1YWP5_9BACT|nr:MAG: hypothetical protein A2Y84_01445 [Candidatus Colwellbacteria bacterium RBG_13_48_8]